MTTDCGEATSTNQPMVTLLLASVCQELVGTCTPLCYLVVRYMEDGSLNPALVKMTRLLFQMPPKSTAEIPASCSRPSEDTLMPTQGSRSARHGTGQRGFQPPAMSYNGHKALLAAGSEQRGNETKS